VLTGAHPAYRVSKSEQSEQASFLMIYKHAGSPASR
jgi:hypothetical protein